MNRFSHILVVTLLMSVVVGLLPAFSQTPEKSEKPPYLQKIEEFFRILKGKEAEKAVDFIYAGNPWIQKNSDAIVNVRNKLKSLTDLVGEFYNYDLILEKNVADRLVVLYYFAAYERQPLKFEFQFYRPKDEWVIQSFSFQADLEDDVRKAVQDEVFRSR